MPVKLINPEGLPQPQGYAQVGIATGSRIVYLSGQVARTADGGRVGAGDLAAQTEQADLNLATGLADVAKLTVYVVDWSEERMADLVTGAMRAAERLGFDPVRPITLIGVAALGEPDLLVEVEAVAVLE